MISRMRVALCISGQPRNALETFPFIYHHIIQPNNADVFFHTYFDPNNLSVEKTHMNRGNCTLDKNIIENLISLYKPVRYLVEQPKSFYKQNYIVPTSRIQRSRELNSSIDWTDEQHKRHTLKQMMSMFYSIFKANELKENYANETGITYDYVIRIRFDIVPREPILCDTLDPDVLYFQDLAHPDHFISDWINIGSNLIMNVYSSLYLFLEYYNSFKFHSKEARYPTTVDSGECGGYYECMIRDIITLHKIPFNARNFNCTLHPRA
jgi:hypothetical protein